MPAYGEEAEKLARDAAVRLRALRLSFGYETAASFARALGYKPGTYRRYERRFPVQCFPFRKLTLSIRRIGPVSLDWLLSGDLNCLPPSMQRDTGRLAGRVGS